MSAFLFDAALCLLLVGVACAAVGTRDLFAAIAFFVTYGILVALAWLRLQAVDVAMAEAAIGAGLTGVLLIGAWSMLRRHESALTEAIPSPASRIATGLAAVLVTGLLALAVLALPAEDAGLTAEVAANLAASGVENPVTAVLLNFRAYDTLLESVVLFAALVAVWALTPGELWGHVPGLRQHARSGGVLGTFGRLLPPLGLMVAVYLVWAGSDRPGGAFQAGTVLAAVWLLAAMSGALPFLGQTNRPQQVALVAGPAVFLAVGLAGAAGGVFLGLPPALAKTLIVTIEFALAFSIAATLALLVAGVPRETR